MTNTQARIVDTAVGPVEVAEVGGGPAVLVVHGSPGDWRQGLPLALDLAGAHRVLLPSRPGYGRTPLSTGREIDQQAAAHVALLDALGIDRAAVVGVSGGGPSSRAFAAHHAERCTALVLVCAVAPHLIEIPSAMRLVASVPGVWPAAARMDARLKSRLLAKPDRLQAHLLAELTPEERVLAEEDPRVVEDLVVFFREHLAAMRSVTGLRNDYRTFRAAHDVRPPTWPAASAVPTLVMHGDTDTVVGLEASDWHAAHIPGAQLEVLSGAGHAFLITMRRQTSPRIAGFLSGVTS